MSTNAQKSAFQPQFDRRQFPKPQMASRRVVRERCSVQVLALGSELGSTIAEGIILDIGTGAGLIVNAEIEPGSQVVLEIKTHAFTCRVPARVVWYGKLPSTDRIIKEKPGMIWRMGFAFGPFTDDELEVVERLMRILL